MRAAWALLVASALLHLVVLAVWPGSAPVGTDIDVYRHGGLAVLHGAPLYTRPVDLGYVWTYSPFAALVMVPLGLVGVGLLIPLGMVLQVVLVLAVAAGVWHVESRTADRSWLTPAVVATAAAALWLEPVWLTIALGQVNLLLMAMVLLDLGRRDRPRWQGALVGVAAGIKLTPLVFLPYLLITRRYRAAATSVAAFAATIAVGFAVLPADSSRFWTHTFFSADRVAPASTPGNQSIRGALVRAGLEDRTLTLTWLALVAVVGVLGMVAAWLAWQRDRPALSTTLVGLTGAAISPFSWEHHWVWLLPLLVVLLAQGRRLAAAVVALLCAAWFVSSPAGGPEHQPPIGLFRLRLWSWSDAVTGNLFVLVCVVTLVAVVLGGLSRRRPPTSTDTLGA
ncbi:DUF2029 domain-containing protein [Nocardioides mangrovicus]|uniref:DUF2029 domain-containing protein n=1 Tax=Nocardioides mangrovicus TaxID=2478913 RepID=A0A3L8P0V6_9ACTN|nr:glycosyltransferase 87 family protein [Nocardioides mangrovicus]RLV48018.1 DUF2029 domain-containing protein [Nocardioides mangrovicus]